MIAEGIPKAQIEKFKVKLEKGKTMVTGNGEVPCTHAIPISGPLIGRMMVYLLKDAPFCISMGQTVQDGRRPFIWIPGQLPFHVTDPSKLEVLCPMKYRMYADHMDRNNPMLKMEFRLGHGEKALPCRPVQPNFSAFPLREADPAPGGDGVAAGDGLDEVMTVPDVPCDEDPVEAGDRTIRLRTKTKEFLMEEAQSARHKRSHYPHNPFCNVCVQAHLRQQTFKRRGEKSDDGLPAVIAPLTEIGTDTMIIAKSGLDNPTSTTHFALYFHHSHKEYCNSFRLSHRGEKFQRRLQYSL